MRFLKNIFPFLISIFFVLVGCSPKLSFSEIEEKINDDYVAFNEGDVEYKVKNHPLEYIKEYGEDGLRKRYVEAYTNRDYPAIYSDIGSLMMQERNKCNSTYFYKVKYLVDKTQMTPYLDSTALELNYKEYGKDNVHFNSNAKILQVRLAKEQILIYDKDDNWKLMRYTDFDEKLYDRLFNLGFSKCLVETVENSEYLPYQ